MSAREIGVAPPGLPHRSMLKGTKWVVTGAIGTTRLAKNLCVDSAVASLTISAKHLGVAVSKKCLSRPAIDDVWSTVRSRSSEAPGTQNDAELSAMLCSDVASPLSTLSLSNAPFRQKLSSMMLLRMKLEALDISSKDVGVAVKKPLGSPAAHGSSGADMK